MRNIQGVNGFLNVDKPQGITSHDVVDVIRKIFPKIKVGHTGTLDPIATGVLPISIGEATKLTSRITSEDKEYHVKMLLGVETDTYDVTGKIVFASVINKDEIYIKERIKRFIGPQMQTPPIYSAIKVNGKKAYDYAREGKEVELSPRKIEIFAIENIEVDIPKKEVAFDVSCTKGTYIRSLVHDIGEKLGCGATMIELRRLRTGNFDINKSVKLYDYLKLEYNDMISNVISIEEYYKESKKISLTNSEYNKFKNGVSLDLESQEDIVRIYVDSKFKGLGTVENNKLKRYIIEDKD